LANGRVITASHGREAGRCRVVDAHGRFRGKGGENEPLTISYRQSSVKPVKTAAAGPPGL
ncbi:MAG: hypothetical protein V3V75_10295, partial [Thermoguttaceae bacterium]